MRQVLFVLITLAGLLAVAPVLAQPAQPDAEQLRALAELLRDPEIQRWLQAQAEGVPAGAPQASAAAGDAAMVHQVMAGRLDAMRAFLRATGGCGPVAARRAPPGLDAASGRNAGARAARRGRAPGRVRCARLRAGVAVLGCDLRFAGAHDRKRPDDDARARARDRAAHRLRSRRAARVRRRQHRRLPAVRVAAAAQGDRARLSAGLSQRAPGARARPHPARARRRTLSGHPHGDAERTVLVRLVGYPDRLVSLRAGHARPAGDAGRQ